MGFLDPLIADFHQNVKPHITNAATIAHHYADRMCHRLDAMHADQLMDREPGMCMAVPIALPQDATATNVFLVPAGEEYVLESITTDTPAPVFVRLANDGMFKTMTNNNVRTEPVRFLGPCMITASLATAAGALPTPAYVQFRRLAKLARPTQYGGRVETGLEPVDARRVHDPLAAGIGIA